MASAQEHGKVYIQFESSDGSKSATPIQADTHAIGHTVPASATDRRQFYPLSYMHGGAVLNENGVLKVLFKSTGADIIESEESSLLLDCTLINKATGSKQPVTITFEDMTGFTVAGAVDLTLLAGQTTLIATYTVPSGTQLVIGQPSGLGKAYCFIGDDT